MEADTASRYHALRVSAVIDETHDAKSFVFEIPATLAVDYRYKSGQFLTLRLTMEGRHVPRCYSMSSAPMVDSALRVTVKRVHQGRGSNWLCDRLQVGDQVEVMPPAGVFTPRALDGDFLLLGGGSGITPGVLYSALGTATGPGPHHAAVRQPRRALGYLSRRAESAGLQHIHPGCW